MSLTIRVCTWNIQLGLQLETILGTLRTQDDFEGIDLLALQETSIRLDREDADRIAAALGPRYESYQVTAHRLGTDAQANGLVWNNVSVRILHKDTISLPRAREVNLAFPERTFLRALREQSRNSVLVDGTIGGETLRVYIAHLDVLGLAHKLAQFYRILTDAKTRRPSVSSTIVMGDFNTFRFGSRPSWAGMAAAAKSEGFEDLTTDIRWTHRTFRRFRFRQKLDAIFIRRAQPIRYHSWSLDIPGSDHIPVFAEITLL